MQTFLCQVHTKIEPKTSHNRTIPLCSRSLRNPILKPEFDVWKIKGREKLTAYRNGEISADEFRNWFMDDEWTKN